jgi:hypothetical protein
MPLPNPLFGEGIGEVHFKVKYLQSKFAYFLFPPLGKVKVGCHYDRNWPYHIKSRYF